VDSTRAHPKIGSTLKSRRRVRVAGKPFDEPLRKGETQSLTGLVVRVSNLTALSYNSSRYYHSFQSMLASSTTPTQARKADRHPTQRGLTVTDINVVEALVRSSSGSITQRPKV